MLPQTILLVLGLALGLLTIGATQTAPFMPWLVAGIGLVLMHPYVKSSLNVFFLISLALIALWSLSLPHHTTPPLNSWWIPISLLALGLTMQEGHMKHDLFDMTPYVTLLLPFTFVTLVILPTTATTPLLLSMALPLTWLASIVFLHASTRTLPTWIGTLILLSIGSLLSGYAIGLLVVPALALPWLLLLNSPHRSKATLAMGAVSLFALTGWLLGNTTPYTPLPILLTLSLLPIVGLAMTRFPFVEKKSISTPIFLLAFIALALLMSMGSAPLLGGPGLVLTMALLGALASQRVEKHTPLLEDPSLLRYLSYITKDTKPQQDNP